MRRLSLLAALALAPRCAAQEEKEQRSQDAGRPNILVILADDLGYGDIGVHGCRDIPTPNIDSLARDGVRCTSGYVSGPLCGPTRSGLLTGRYQERFGCELSADRGLPLEELTVAERLKPAGYATGLVGKWHLGVQEKQHPNARGFDEFFGFLGGANSYLPQAPDGVVPSLLRNREPAQEKGYVTEAFGREAIAFIERHKEEPFFLYLAFSAPHRPLEVTETYLKRFSGIADPNRRKFAAMVSAMDDAIGAVLAKLSATGLDEKTLVFFLSDNGGAVGKRRGNSASNAPLRGQKGTTWEGGIRVPFLARWKGKLPAGRVYEQPVISLDICPTVLALAGVEVQPEWRLDGVDLLPYLAGHPESDSRPPHEALYWRFSSPPRRAEFHSWAIRQGDLKLVQAVDRDLETGALPATATLGLFDVARDPGEKTDLKADRAEEARALEARWKQWNSSLPPFEPGAQASEPGEDER